MTTIVTRITNPTGGTAKGSPLTSAEIDQNFINLNDNKLEITDLVSTNTANKGVKRDGSGGFSAGDISVGAVTATSLNISGSPLPATMGGTGASSSSGNGYLLIGNSSNTWSVARLTGTSNQITVTNSSGGITLSTPQDIGTASNVQHASFGVGTSASGVSGRIDATTVVAGTLTETSSITLKENINPIQNALESIIQLSGVVYDRKDGSYKNEPGMIAEDVFKIIPNLVTLDKEGKVEGITYTKVVAYLIEAIKELKTEIDTIKGNK